MSAPAGRLTLTCEYCGRVTGQPEREHVCENCHEEVWDSELVDSEGESK